MKNKLSLINIDFTYFLKLNTIYKLKTKQITIIESNIYVRVIEENLR